MWEGGRRGWLRWATFPTWTQLSAGEIVAGEEGWLRWPTFSPIAVSISSTTSNRREGRFKNHTSKGFTVCDDWQHDIRSNIQTLRYLWICRNLHENNICNILMLLCAIMRRSTTQYQIEWGTDCKLWSHRLCDTHSLTIHPSIQHHCVICHHNHRCNMGNSWHYIQSTSRLIVVATPAFCQFNCSLLQEQKFFCEHIVTFYDRMIKVDIARENATSTWRCTFKSDLLNWQLTWVSASDLVPSDILWRRPFWNGNWKRFVTWCEVWQKQVAFEEQAMWQFEWRP